MRDSTLANIQSALSTWLVTFVFLGYPLVALIPTVLDKASTFVSIPYRMLMLTLAILVLVVQYLRRASAWRIDLMCKILIIAYLMRLGWDTLYLDIPNASHAFLFFIVVCLIPALAIGKAGLSALNEIQVATSLALVGTTVCGVTVILYLLDLGVNRSLMELTGRLSFEALNPISLGYVAVTTLLSIVWLNSKQSWTFWRLVSLCIVTIIALSCLILAASRGPVIGFGFCMLWLLLYAPTMSRRILIILIMAVVFYSVTSGIGKNLSNKWHFTGNLYFADNTYFNDYLFISENFHYGYNFSNANIKLQSEKHSLRISRSFHRNSWINNRWHQYNNNVHIHNDLRTRLSGGLSDRSSLERITLLKQGVDIFLQSPLVGSAYVDYNKYPHNVYLEAAMSLGIIGLFLLISIVLRPSRCLAFRHTKGSSIFALLFLEYLINTLLSSSIWGMAEFWVLLVLLTSQPRSNPVRYTVLQENVNLRTEG